MSWTPEFQHVLYVQLISCTLRSGLHEIPTMIRTFPHGLENNHACIRAPDIFFRNAYIYTIPGKISQNHLHAWLFSNPCGQVLISCQARLSLSFLDKMNRLVENIRWDPVLFFHRAGGSGVVSSRIHLKSYDHWGALDPLETVVFTNTRTRLDLV